LCVQLKDLKRQVQTERKRADKLQEKLQELLSDNMKGRQCQYSLETVHVILEKCCVMGIVETFKALKYVINKALLKPFEADELLGVHIWNR
jgi:hypothetical protein